MPVTASQAISLALFVAALASILCANILLFVTIAKVNRKLSADQQISYLGGHPLMYGKIFRDYHRFYPRGRLVLCFYMCAFIAVGLLIAFGWEAGFF
jgi:hypothetical protein